MTAQPFGHGQRGGERWNSQRALRPEKPRKRNPDRHVDRGRGRQRRHRERHEPAEGLRIDKERMADPVKPEQKIAETEPPADRGRAPHAAETIGRAVDQPDEQRERQKQNRPGIDRRQRQHRQGARHKGKRGATPAVRQHDRMIEPSQRHGRRLRRRVLTSGTTRQLDLTRMRFKSFPGMAFPHLQG